MGTGNSGLSENLNDNGLRKLRIDASCVRGVQTKITSLNHTWYVDEPLAFSGEDSAPSPVEMLLGALASCVVAAGHFIACEMSLEQLPIEVTVEGLIDSARFFGKNIEDRAGFQSIAISINMPPQWSPENQTRWKNEVLSRCPVIDNIMNLTEVTLDFAGESIAFGTKEIR